MVTTGTQICRWIEFYSKETAKVLARKQLRSLSEGDDDYGDRILTRLLLTQFKQHNLRIRRSRRRK